MNSEYFEKLQHSFKPFIDTLKSYEAMNDAAIKNISNTLISYAKIIDDISRPLRENIGKLGEVLAPIAEISDSFRILAKLGEEQFIWFTSLDRDIMKEFDLYENANLFLEDCIEKSEFFETNEIIKAIRKSSAMREKSMFFSQSISAYRRKHYLLSCVGLISIIEFLLTQISGVKTTKFLEKVEVAVAKANTDEVINEYDAKYFYMSFGLEKTLNTVFEFSKFEEDEPSTLNRHWIAHGNTKKQYTKLDCVKLINLIYALLLISNIEGGGTDE